MKKHIKIITIVVIIFLVSIFAFQVIVFSFITNKVIVEECKKFILNNKSVNDYFGGIKSIRLKMFGSERHWGGNEGTGGSYSFYILGEKKGGTVKAEWREDSNKIDITMVSTREGLANTRILWPEPKTRQKSYLLPSNIWDGIILMIMNFIIFLFYLNIRREGLLVKFFFPFITWTDGSRKFFKWWLLTGIFIGCIFIALCLFKGYTIF